MKKKTIRTSITWILVTAMVSSVVFSWIPENGVMMAQAAQRTIKKDAASSYVVTMKEQRAMETVCERYEDILDACPEENPEVLREEGIVVSDMTAAEAEQLERDSRVLSVEENLTLEGSRVKKRNGKGERARRIDLATEGGKYVDVYPSDNWNLETIHAADADNEKIKGKEPVRVAVLDSGVDMLENIEVKERVNLIPEQEDFTVMFEDEAGHGTAVAGIIAGETMSGETAAGINRNVELYSAKVLDENNQAPLSRVIEGIYWAIEKNVHIINMSFGTSQYSRALENAVKAAADRGILIVAAAGNQGNQGTNTVEYPAAFPEVLAVGSVDAGGQVSDFSAKGEEVELMAPGEAVRVTGAFGADMVVSGTSMAAPHVTAVASLLWEKDLSKSAEFIRTLLDESARNLGDGTEDGYGLLDYGYAQRIYDVVERQMESGQEIAVPENTARVQVFDNSGDVEKLEEGETDRDDGEVKGSWKWTEHKAYLEDKNINLPAMKQAVVYPDKAESGVKDMKKNPDFHGYYTRTNGERVNYMASYHFMIKIANAYGKGKDYTNVARCKGLTDASYNAIRAGFKGMNKKIKSYSSKKDRKAFVYGIAMHTATDVFAHSTLKFSSVTRLNYSNEWEKIRHEFTSKSQDIVEADNKDFKKRRFIMAYRVQRNNIYRFQGKRDDVSVLHDFHAHGDDNGDYYSIDPGNKRYRVIRLLDNAKAAGVTNGTVLKHFGLLNISQFKED